MAMTILGRMKYQSSSRSLVLRRNLTRVVRRRSSSWALVRQSSPFHGRSLSLSRFRDLTNRPLPLHPLSPLCWGLMQRRVRGAHHALMLWRLGAPALPGSHRFQMNMPPSPSSRLSSRGIGTSRYRHSTGEPLAVLLVWCSPCLTSDACTWRQASLKIHLHPLTVRGGEADNQVIAMTFRGSHPTLGSSVCPGARPVVVIPPLLEGEEDKVLGVEGIAVTTASAQSQHPRPRLVVPPSSPSSICCRTSVGSRPSSSLPSMPIGERIFRNPRLRKSSPHRRCQR